METVASFPPMNMMEQGTFLLATACPKNEEKNEVMVKFQTDTNG